MTHFLDIDKSKPEALRSIINRIEHEAGAGWVAQRQP